MPNLCWLVVGLFGATAAAQVPPPISVGIVFDTSGSVGQKIGISRQAVSELFKATRPEDEFFIVQSSDRTVLLNPFSRDTETIQYRLTFSQPGGRSALLDAIYMGLFQIKNAKNLRKALLVISDGGNNNSRYREREIKGLVREVDIPIFAVGVYESFAVRGRTEEELFGPALLHRIAEQSRARHFAVESLAELPDVIAQVASALLTGQR